MAEQHKPVQVYSVAYVCDTCHAGQMLPTGVVLTSLPAQYPHKCNQCGAAQTFRKRYPTTEMKELP